MSPRRLFALLAVAAVAGLLLWRSVAGGGPLRYYAPQDYITHADAFIQAGYLGADCLKGKPRLVLKAAQAPAAERSWYKESYLAEDVHRFNSDPDDFGWTFAIDDDCRLRAVNPVVHRIKLPFVDPIRWLGSLFYRGQGAQAMLRSADRTITLRALETPVDARNEATTEVGAKKDVSEEGAVLLHFAGGRGQPAARVFPLGQDVVLNNRTRRGQPESVRLLGHPLPVGRFARLETGDWLHLEAETPRRAETLVYVGGQALSAASRMRLENDHYERKTEDPHLGLLPAGPDDQVLYLDAIAGGIEAALGAFPEPRARALAEGFDLQLTLDRQVQTGLSQAFHNAVQKVQGDHPGKPFGAGMTVLDGKTGAVLALASYPWEEDLEGLPALDAAERSRLLTNQNLRLHPIGSAGKPFFFTAIAHAFPFLMEMVIDPYAKKPAERDLLQCELPKGYRIPEGWGAPVDFRTALQISSNRYTAELATLALAASTGRLHGSAEPIPCEPEITWPRPGQSSGIRLGGKPLSCPPDLGGFVFEESGSPQEPDSRAAERCANLDRFEQVPFRAPLELLTGAATYWGADPQRLPQGPAARLTRVQFEDAYKTNRFDLGLFAPLLSHLFQKTDETQQWKVRAGIQQVAPERVNLAFNQVSRLREDFITLLLGGGTSIWTNLQLTEAMSRLVTGRAVESRIVERILPRKDGQTVLPPAAEPPSPLAPELAIRPEARRTVLEGLVRVGKPGGGTAGTMEAVLQKLRAGFPGDRIDLYSKTGSPILEHPVPAATARALERLVAKSRLALDGKTLRVRTKAASVPHAFPEEAGRAAFRNALERALAEVGFPSPGHWLTSYLADLLDDFADDLEAHNDAPIEGPLSAVGGALRLNRENSLFRQRLVQGKGGVYLFSLVRRPAGAGDTPIPSDFANPNSRIVTVAIFLATGPDSHVAVAVARQILPVLGPLLQ